jgi:hypothetical protein
VGERRSLKERRKKYWKKEERGKYLINLSNRYFANVSSAKGDCEAKGDLFVNRCC